MVDAVGGGDRHRTAPVERNAYQWRSADHPPGTGGGEQKQAGVASETFGNETTIPVIEGDSLGPAKAGVHPARRSVRPELDDLVAGRQCGAGDEQIAERIEGQVIGRNRGAQVREHAYVAVVADPVERSVTIADHQLARWGEPEPGCATEILGEHVEDAVVTHPVNAPVLTRGHVERVVRPPRQTGGIHDAVTHRLGLAIVGQPIDRMRDLLTAPAADRRIQIAAGVVHRIRDNVEILGEESADGYAVGLGFPVVQTYPDIVPGAIRNPHPQSR